MTNVFIFHGAYGYPEENWFGWLSKHLHDLNIANYIPHFPTPENQNLKNWFQYFNHSYAHLINTNSILIGHSLGCAFILRLLERYYCKLPLVVLVGPFTGEIGIPKFDEINYSFFNTDIAWNKIKSKVKKFICYYGDNDPYVTPENFNFICKQLSSEKIIISNGGHLNTKSGYTQFPQLLNYLKQHLDIS